MPVTKTAKRAQRSSQQKKRVNLEILRKLEIALRKARKEKSEKSIKNAISLADRAVKKKTIHKNKGARIKSKLSKLSPTKTSKKTTKK